MPEAERRNRNCTEPKRGNRAETRVEARSKCTEARMEAGRTHHSRSSPTELRSKVRGENRSRPQNRYGEQAVHTISLAEIQGCQAPSFPL